MKPPQLSMATLKSGYAARSKPAISICRGVPMS
jgi:hypothetical protein